MKKQLLTLCLVYEYPKILLAMKKEGEYGAGYYNGFGGKVNEGETIEDALKREFNEESNMSLESYEKIGVAEFEFEEKPNHFDLLEVHIYRAIKYYGEPKETKEMRPEWFDVSMIPQLLNEKKMWEADRKWLPLFLHNKKFIGKFRYNNAKEKKLLSYGINVVDRLE